MWLNFNRRRLGGAAMFAVIAACTVLSGAALAPAMAEDAVVTIDNFAFSPEVLTVKPGTKVTFMNHDDIPHSVVDEAGKFKSAALDTDESFSTTLNDAGEVIYFCGLHPHMKGKIVVSP